MHTEVQCWCPSSDLEQPCDTCAFWHFGFAFAQCTVQQAAARRTEPEWNSASDCLHHPPSPGQVGSGKPCIADESKCVHASLPMLCLFVIMRVVSRGADIVPTLWHWPLPCACCVAYPAQSDEDVSIRPGAI
eukprot:jgi/Ulvmu1/11061/UM007_0243.1